ncbi:hypothetical protein [Acanthopleuribacter pedis]|uniref:Uncharacterized protein n=1 Tax=Acanthopleuribacter pedis TaxID=442870 RepID=A0A8J7U6H0_9BACT|nr:hypothetical protein [Acanthopleuribacter pedis]MBO1321448.1 hypothetical protein [Acanthopleuribacter pedis]
MSGVGKPPNINSTPLTPPPKIEKSKDPSLTSSTLQESETSWNPLQGMMRRLSGSMPQTGDQVIDSKLIQPMKEMTPQFPVKEGLEETFSGRMSAMQRLSMTGTLPMVGPFFEHMETMKNTHQHIDTLDHQDVMELSGTFVKHKVENMSLLQMPRHAYQLGTTSMDKIDEVKETQQELVTKTKQKMMTQVGTSLAVGQGLRKGGQMMGRMGGPRGKVLGLAMQGMGVAFGTSGALKVGYDMEDVGHKVGGIVKDKHPTTQLFLEKMNHPKTESTKGPDTE